MAAIAVRRIEKEVGATLQTLSTTEAIRHKAFQQSPVVRRERVNDLGSLRSVDYLNLEQAASERSGQLENGIIRILSSEGPPGQVAWQ